MLLYLVRHGPAVNREDPDCPPDPQRPLTPKGAEKTRLALEGLRRMGVKPELILSSPLLRALQTAEIAAEALGYPRSKIRKTEALVPGADPADLFEELAGVKSSEILCAGHAPHVDEFIARAVGCRTTFTMMKKAGAACLEFESPAAARGVLLWLMPPKFLWSLGE